MHLVKSSGWYSVRDKELDLAVEYVQGVPGVVHRAKSIEIHTSHLPLLPAELQPDRSSTPRDIHFHSPFELRDYQQEAVDFGLTRSSVLFLHDLGMGKTAMALAMVQAPSLAVVPTSAVYGWKSAAEAMGMKVQILHGKFRSGYLDPDVDLYVTTYGSAGNWIPLFKRMAGGPELFAMIADEVHLMHKKPLKWTQAFAGTRCKVRCGLTATPIRNRMPSLWGVLNAVQPKAWGTRLAFLERYADAFMGQYGMELGAPTHIDELSIRLKEIVLRRMWSEPGMDTHRPNLVRERVEVPIAAKRRVKHLDLATRRAMEKRNQGAQTIRMLTEQRQETGMLKVQWALSSGWLEKEAVDRIRTIWWCWFKPQAHAIYKAAKAWDMPVDMITGDSLSKKRAEVLEEWEHGDIEEPRMLVATQGALNFAVNLTTAHSAIFVEYDWAPVTLVQAEKRHHRPGNPLEEVTASYLVIPGTTDDDIAEALYTKIEEEELIFGAAGGLEQVGPLTKHGIITNSSEALEELAKQICGKRR